jgi:RHS repeat-associated core domain
MGEVTKQTRVYKLPFMEKAVTIATCFTYDSWGRTLNMTYPDGETVRYGYDYGGQLKSVNGHKNRISYSYIDSIFYDKFGAKTLVGYSNELITTYEYNPQNLRLTSQSIKTEPNTAEDYLDVSYTYDPIGNIIGMNTTNHLLPDFSTTQTFRYDAANQLDSASGNGGNLYTATMSYGNYGRVNTYNGNFTDPQQPNTPQQISTSFVYQTTDAPSNNFAAISANNGDISFEYGINGSLRKKQTGDTTEYYLFNAFEQMKAYSENGLTYGYYGYDAAGERMYKVTLNKTTSRTNSEEGNVLEVEKMTLYPNGFININQNGDYTKHYYAEEARIASKIGSGNKTIIAGDSLRDNTPLAVMMQELGELTHDTIDDISCDFEQITQLQGEGGKENGLYFYHGNHLSSTQIVTDITGAVTQAVLYAPFGEVITEYNAYWMLDTIPRFLFNAKELDEESGMYYYSARYYAPPTFISRDPLFEKYPFISPYAYCYNNPVIYIDPDGEFAFVGAIIGFTVGGITEIVSQTITNGITNLENGDGFFSGWTKNMDWADVGISAAVGALDGFAPGAGRMVGAIVGDAAKAAFDWDAEGPKMVGVNKNWDKSLAEFSCRALSTLAFGAAGMNKVPFGRSKFSFGEILFEAGLKGGLNGIVGSGTKKWVDYVIGKNSILLPETIISAKRGEYDSSTGKITKKGEESFRKQTQKYYNK